MSQRRYRIFLPIKEAEKPEIEKYEKKNETGENKNERYVRIENTESESESETRSESEIEKIKKKIPMISNLDEIENVSGYNLRRTTRQPTRFNDYETVFLTIN